VKTFIAALLASLALPGVAFAHAQVSPPVGLKGESQVYTLAVPTEKENLTTTEIEFSPPAGFNIDSFVPSPGWKRSLQSTGSGEQTVVQKVTWTGGKVPTGEDAVFQFLASTSGPKTYTFKVRQTYSDGSVVDWSGPESSNTPAPTIEAKSSLGGGGSSTLSIIALAVAVLAAVLAAAALLVRTGGRTLT
jgi:uncharacterized protein YcnI